MYAEAGDMAMCTKLPIRHGLGAKSFGSRFGKGRRHTLDSGFKNDHAKAMGEAARRDDILPIVLAIGL